ESGYLGAMLKGKPEIRPDAETHRGVKFTAVTMTWDLDKMAEQAPPGAGDAMKNYFAKMMGDQLHVWMGVEGKRLIQVVAKDWSSAKERLETFLDQKKPVGETPAFR